MKVPVVFDDIRFERRLQPHVAVALVIGSEF